MPLPEDLMETKRERRQIPRLEVLGQTLCSKGRRWSWILKIQRRKQCFVGKVGLDGCL